MTRKQYRRKQNYILGYKRGYHVERPLPTAERKGKNTDYRRGYAEARRDRRTGEAPLY